MPIYTKIQEIILNWPFNDFGLRISQLKVSTFVFNLKFLQMRTVATQNLISAPAELTAPAE